MQIIADKAAEFFFHDTSLLYVYYEAIANAIDANATNIKIDITVPDFNDVNDFEISIEDNGDGFTDVNFERFKQILNTVDENHKGIGRLVFLNYFKNINIQSFFENKSRTFTFSNNFNGESELKENTNGVKGSKLIFKNYKKKKILSYDFVNPSPLKESILLHFYPQFYQLKENNKELNIKITLKTNTENIEKQFFNEAGADLSITKIPNLKKKTQKASNYLFENYTLLYSIKKTLGEPTTLISAICSDGRTIPFEAVSKKELPYEHEYIFLLSSELFKGKSNPNRESLDLDNAQSRATKKAFVKMVAEVIEEELPEIRDSNAKLQRDLQKKYPHLVGYFDRESIGVIDREITVKEAQEKFFISQKEILEATELDDDKYQKSLDVASRLLTEYILYRTKIIQKLKTITPQNKENDIHSVLVPKKEIFKNSEKIKDIYNNNIWIIDDKFMTYSKILSDIELDKIFDEIHVKGTLKYDEKQKGKEDGRPDITIVLSEDPNCENKIDVVIVELKRLGIDLAKKEEIISQIKQRARRLMEFYPNKIQRIWFYGVIDYDKEFRASILESGYKKLFSTGEILYNKERVLTNPDDETSMKDIDVFVMEYKTMLQDAEKRNSTFLNILKETIRSEQSI